MNTEQTYWYNDIPQHWQIKRLKDIASCNDETLSEVTSAEKEIEYVEISDVNEAQSIINTSFFYFYDAPSRARRITKKGDVIISTVRTYLKAIALIDRCGLIVSTGFAVLRSNRNTEPRFLHYLTLNNNFLEGVIRESAGVSYPAISASKLVASTVAIPALSEQVKISNYLDNKISNIDAYVSERKKERLLLSDLKKAKVTEVVTKGLSPNVQLKDSGIPSIGMIPAHWGVKRLKELFEFGSGLPISKADLLETGIPVISYGQIHAKFNRGTKVEEQLIRYVDPSYLETNPSSLVNKGDVIFADTSEDLEGCGNCVYIDKQMPLFAGYHTVILKCRKENPYLAYLFQSSNWREQIRKRVCGVKLYSITKTILNSVYVILPPIEEQIQTVEYLDHECEQIEKKCTLIDKQIQQLQLLKRALINEVVTGKKAI